MGTVTRPDEELPDPGDDMLAEQVRDWITNILAFMEGNNADENNVDYTSTDGIVVKSQAQTLTGLKTLEITSAGGGGVREALKIGVNPASGTPAASDGLRLTFYADDAGGTQGNRGYIDLVLESAVAGAVDAYFNFYVDVGDTPTSGLTLGKEDVHLDVIGPSRTHTAATNAYIAWFRPGGARTVPAGTTAVVATMRLDEPNITATGTVTTAATLYISGAPTEGSSNYGIYSSGAARFEGTYDKPVWVGGLAVWDNATDHAMMVKYGAPSSDSDGQAVAFYS